MSKSNLDLWKERLQTAQEAYQTALDQMDEREELYRGNKKITSFVSGEKTTEAAHVRNIIAELIEAQVDSTIPAPKVTAKYKKDEHLAKMIEDMLRNEIDRLPMEMLNDRQERCVPLQGGGLWLIEWDPDSSSHVTAGDVYVSALHPKQVIPQAGVWDNVEDMDYIFVKQAQTKEYIKRVYGVDVKAEAEEEPDIRAVSSSDPSDEIITQYTVYYRNDNGGIGMYSWSGDTEIVDYDDYQARRLKRCKDCGRPESTMERSTETDENGEKVTYEAGRCQYCGGELESGTEDHEDSYAPIRKSDGMELGGATDALMFNDDGTPMLDENGLPMVEPQPTHIPYYKPDIYPVILQRNVSVYGQFLGESDADKIRSHQNATNRIETKILKQLIQGGSYMTLPNDPSIKIDTDDMKPIRIKTPQEAAQISVQDIQGNIEQPLVYLNQLYEEARQAIGITDSFQGRKDTTATSGKAKEFAAAQSAGRLESKRVMKQAAFAQLYEAIFKFKLAYADEPRPVVAQDERGNSQYEAFSRYDFLERDDAGNYYWNDNFLFSTDPSASLANNREAMWQETRQNLQTGAFGDPTQLSTLILFWSKMELLHYPGAGDTKKYLEEQLQQQIAQQQRMQQMQQQQMMMSQGQTPMINTQPQQMGGAFNG